MSDSNGHALVGELAVQQRARGRAKVTAKAADPRRPLTSGEVASMLGVAVRTVSDWIDEGHLAGWRLPGGTRDRRTTREAVLAFCARNKAPVPPELGVSVLACGLPEGTQAPHGARLVPDVVAAALLLGAGSAAELHAGTAMGRHDAALPAPHYGGACRLVWYQADDGEPAPVGWEVANNGG